MAGTALPSRIRLCRREAEYAISSSTALLAARPDARPQGNDNAVIDSFFDNTADAQVMLTEKFNILSALRQHEAAEVDVLIGLAGSVGVTPVLPKVRFKDATRGLNIAVPIAGIAIDRGSERNSVEGIG